MLYILTINYDGKKTLPEFASLDTNNSLKSRLDMKDNRKCIKYIIVNLDLEPLFRGH